MHRLNAHLASIVSSGSFQMPVEVTSRGIVESAPSRLSSFGYSGTIAHALVTSVQGQRVWPSSSTASGISLYRRKALHSLAGVTSGGRLAVPPLHLAARGTSQSDDAVVSTDMLALFSQHVVGDSILLPGVGFVEIALAADTDRHSVLSAVAFVRPCLLPEPRSGTLKRFALRRTRRSTGAVEIAS